MGNWRRKFTPLRELCQSRVFLSNFPAPYWVDTNPGWEGSSQIKGKLSEVTGIPPTFHHTGAALCSSTLFSFIGLSRHKWVPRQVFVACKGKEGSTIQWTDTIPGIAYPRLADLHRVFHLINVFTWRLSKSKEKCKRDTLHPLQKLSVIVLLVLVFESFYKCMVVMSYSNSTQQNQIGCGIFLTIKDAPWK